MLFWTRFDWAAWMLHHPWSYAPITVIAAMAFGYWAAGKILDRADRRRTAKMARARMRVELTVGDITLERVDAIVNAAKPSLMGGGGVDGAIHQAGGPLILRQCRALRESRYPNGLPAGEAVATSGGDLPAPWVIHTVGPIYSRNTDRSAQLRSCYTAALRVAAVRGCRTVAFPLISSGVYGWPVEDAIYQALVALRAARTTVQTARLVLFDEKTYRLACAIDIDNLEDKP